MGAFTQEMGKITQRYTHSVGLFLGEMPGVVEDSSQRTRDSRNHLGKERGISIALHKPNPSQ